MFKVDLIHHKQHRFRTTDYTPAHTRSKVCNVHDAVVPPEDLGVMLQRTSVNYPLHQRTYCKHKYTYKYLCMQLFLDTHIAHFPARSTLTIMSRFMGECDIYGC